MIERIDGCDMAKQDMASQDIANSVKIALLAARFNTQIVDALVKGALDTLEAQGVPAEHIKLTMVPGAFELPLVAARVAERNMCDVIIALGAVIRGDTPHFDYVAGECARGLARVSLDYKLPVIFGVLTTDTFEQALARSGKGADQSVPDPSGKQGVTNKGADAALAALEMVALLRELK